jgi:hypothetical protein
MVTCWDRRLAARESARWSRGLAGVVSAGRSHSRHASPGSLRRAGHWRHVLRGRSALVLHRALRQWPRRSRSPSRNKVASCVTYSRCKPSRGAVSIAGKVRCGANVSPAGTAARLGHSGRLLHSVRSSRPGPNHSRIRACFLIFSTNNHLSRLGLYSMLKYYALRGTVSEIIILTLLLLTYSPRCPPVLWMNFVKSLSSAFLAVMAVIYGAPLNLALASKLSLLASRPASYVALSSKSCGMRPNLCASEISLQFWPRGHPGREEGHPTLASADQARDAPTERQAGRGVEGSDHVLAGKGRFTGNMTKYSRLGVSRGLCAALAWRSRPCRSGSSGKTGTSHAGVPVSWSGAHVIPGVSERLRRKLAKAGGIPARCPQRSNLPRYPGVD